MGDVPPRSLGAAANVLEWIWEEETLEGRLRRIRRFLENEGYFLPEPPRGVDRSEEGDVHFVRGRQMTVEYAAIDQSGRKVYHYRENEIDRIMLRRIEKYDEWALEHLSSLPHILKTGKMISKEPDKRTQPSSKYGSVRIVLYPCPLSQREASVLSTRLSLWRCNESTLFPKEFTGLWPQIVSSFCHVLTVPQLLPSPKLLY